ncbi:magnesium-translocating P-type ATPase [Coriobacterium glomerans PW2]|uniref:Magnesium-transporting ATPase, P-type 1 n=1 Tax=Coriobacterium glomerans (strain ATCC 49209 / DSM 20642 / JCM 10262 / PW2) TaxID=700015 RepID=F2NA03_CORGP|nr:magnesium-translocating P-type ATPase [Coriobacterium glomerans]AEB06258.1 magnesium-translocating P-type ATPase [Coriobacterium glomerans PW2]
MMMLKTSDILKELSRTRRAAAGRDSRGRVHSAHAQRAASRVAPVGELDERVVFAARHSVVDTLARMGTSAQGLSSGDVEVARDLYGKNSVTHAKEDNLAKRLLDAFVNPFTAILAVLALVSLYTNVIAAAPTDRDPSTVIIIAIMVIISGTLRFTQETKSGNAAASLQKMITTTCTVLREGKEQEVPFSDLVPADIIRLSAGDMIPADSRVMEAKDLFVSQSSLTGESSGVEKTSAELPPVRGHRTSLTISDCDNIVFTGTSVQSGSATAVVLATGNQTSLGQMARVLDAKPPQTSFDRGVADVSRVLVRFMLVMVPIVFVINVITKQNWMDALLFSVSIAVGITPQMLPVIVTTCLAKGATSMSKQKVIIKNLSAIQNLGAMDILCTDKTGTLTEDHVVLERHLDVLGHDDDSVLGLAFLNSYYQTGLKNLIDRAVIERTDELAYCPVISDEEGTVEAVPENPIACLRDRYHKVDEIPFDFDRRRMSVVVADREGKTTLVTKGAAEEILSVCSSARIHGQNRPLTSKLRADIRARVAALNADGLRVIALASKKEPRPVGEFSTDDECEMVLMGYLAFLDPPKSTAAAAIAALHSHGVGVKVLTGDNDRVAAAVCNKVGLSPDDLILGSEIDALSDEELAERAEKTQLFAKLSPLQKARVVRVLRECCGHTVGYMGDGINDAASMRASDCGVSVDTAVDIAKESADIILLEKDLMVLDHGILEGRRTYGNMIKYIKMTASSNFGNVFSVLVASAFLPFLPMTALQLVLLSLIYEISCAAVPWDHVDSEFVARPRTWEARSIVKFMVWFGPTSSIFDIVTYALLFGVICPAVIGSSWAALAASAGTAAAAGLASLFAAVFQSGWFIESMWTQSLIVHTLRTPKIPFIQSRASAPLMVLTFSGIAIVTALPFTPLAPFLGLAPLPLSFFGWLLLIVAGYLLLANTVKILYIRRFGQLL